jgi:hypothetical protein
MKSFILAAVMMAAMPQTGGAQSDSTQNTLSFDLHMLTHGETCAGGLPRGAAEDKSHFLLGRFRLIADYQRQGLQAHAVLQNLAVWGMSGNKALNLYEGWVKMTARNGLFAQVGRIALAYDDERIIGLDDFASAALSHDVLRIGYEGHGHKVHGILGYNQNASNAWSGTYYVDGAQYYKTMQTVWYHYDVPKVPLGVSLLFMNTGLQAGYPEVDQNKDPEGYNKYRYNPAHTEYQQMFGGYVNFHPKHLTLEASYYRQTGKQVDLKNMGSIDIRAWMVGVKAAVNPTESYGFTMGYDYLSGDDYVPVTYGGNFGLPLKSVEGGFSPIYGSREKFYGIMDYFYESAYINGFTPGLQNAFVGVSGNLKLSALNAKLSTLNLGVTYHYLATATKLDRLNSTLGHSIELRASYSFTKDISLTASYTLIKGTETMDRLKQGEGGKTARWGWFSLVVSPSLFTTKW